GPGLLAGPRSEDETEEGTDTQANGKYRSGLCPIFAHGVLLKTGRFRGQGQQMGDAAVYTGSQGGRLTGGREDEPSGKRRRGATNVRVGERGARKIKSRKLWTSQFGREFANIVVLANHGVTLA